MKIKVAKDVKNMLWLKKNHADIAKDMHINILNDPQMILMKCPQEEGPYFEYAPFEFTLDQFIDSPAKNDLGKVKYELTQIYNFWEEFTTFEMISKREDNTWSGLVDNESYECNHDYLISLLFSDPNDTRKNTWCIFSNPVMLIYTKVMDDTDLKKFKKKGKFDLDESENEFMFDNDGSTLYDKIK